MIKFRTAKLAVGRIKAGDGYVWVEIGNVKVMSCYISPNCSMIVFENYLVEIGSEIKRERGNWLIAGDFNAKSHAWHESREDKRGLLLVEWMGENGLITLNEGNTPTFVRRQQNSIIDITMGTENVVRKIAGWKVMEQKESLSLHKYIHYKLMLSHNWMKEKTVERKPGFNLNKIKWELLKKSFEDSISSVETVNENLVMDAVKKACEDAMPNKRLKGRKSVYWWNETIAMCRTACIAKRRVATRAAKKGMEQNRQRYKATKRQRKSLSKKF